MKTPRQQILEDVNMIARLHFVSLEDIMTGGRRPDIVRARHAAFWVVWFFHRRNPAEVGRIFGVSRVAAFYGIGSHMNRIGVRDGVKSRYNSISRRRNLEYSRRTWRVFAAAKKARVAA
jgi:hypothetical protein